MKANFKKGRKRDAETILYSNEDDWNYIDFHKNKEINNLIICI